MRPTRIALAVTLAAACAPPAPPERVFFGNLHSHTAFSDGTGTPEDAYTRARDSAGLHFLAITDHNYPGSDGTGDRKDGVEMGREPTLYTGPRPDAIILTARRMSEDGRFIALYGQEFSAQDSGNHMNVFEVDAVIDVPSGRFDSLVGWMTARPEAQRHLPIVQLNHPVRYDRADEYGADDFDTPATWIATLDRFVRLIEVVNGPWAAPIQGPPDEVMEADYRHFLNLGFHVAPTANQDNHYSNWGTVNDIRTGVVATALTRDAILAALRNRHAYATEDKNLEVVARVNGRLAGSIIDAIPAAGAALDVTLTIRDADEPDATYSVTVYSDAGPGGPAADSVASFPLRGDSPARRPYRLDGVQFQGTGSYLYLRVTQTGPDARTDRAWLAPVWFEGRP